MGENAAKVIKSPGQSSGWSWLCPSRPRSRGCLKLTPIRRYPCMGRQCSADKRHPHQRGSQIIQESP